MKPITCLLLLIPAISSCRDRQKSATIANNADDSVYSSVADIPVSSGFHRIQVETGSFGWFLRALKLKKKSTVYLYNGKPKPYQGAQFAVLDIPVGGKDLQQCADAVMRLRAEYFYGQGLDKKIVFRNGAGTRISFSNWLKGERYKISGGKLEVYHTNDSLGDKRKAFEQYLETVFTYCGTYSLAEELGTPRLVNNMVPGDVFIRPGSPGHAMIVVDVAENDKAEKIFMLAQSYMPAQDIHIVKNPGDILLGPWYRVKIAGDIVTPEWTFHANELKGW